MLADDCAEMVELCSEILNPGYEIVGTASDGSAAIDVCASLTPDIVVLDISMPTLDGLEVARRLRVSHPATIIVFMSARHDWGGAALSAGGTAFVAKTLLSQDLLFAIQQARSGRMFISTPRASRKPPARASCGLSGSLRCSRYGKYSRF